MPAPQRYPAPHEQLLTLARRAKRLGLSFEEFWEQAVPERNHALPRFGAKDAPPGALLWPRDTADRRIAYAAVVETRASWRRAYEGEPPSKPESALRLLMPVLERLAEGNGSGADLSSPGDEDADLQELMAA